MKLGKLPYVRNPRVKLFADYFEQLPVPPAAQEYAGSAPFGMFNNDTVGCCTCTAVANNLVEDESSNSQPITPTDDCVLKAYSAITGYVPGDESTDNGATCTSVLDYWKTPGICNNQLHDYLSIEPGNERMIKTAIWMFGVTYIGLNLPKTSMTQFDNGQPWSVDRFWRVNPDEQPGSLGGHCVVVIGYDDKHYYCVTWAKVQTMTKRFWKVYCDEAYALLDPAWIGATGTAPSGFNWDQLNQDLAEL